MLQSFQKSITDKGCCLAMSEWAVVGGGSLGLLLAGKLAAAGCRVVLWTRTSEQAERIEADGIAIEEMSGVVSQPVRLRAIPISSVKGIHEGPILLTVKQTALDSELYSFLRLATGGAGRIYLFQNGVGHVEKLARALPGTTLTPAITTEGALRLGPSSVRHTGKGAIWFGVVGAAELLPMPMTTGIDSENALFADSSVRNVAEMMKQAGFTVFLSNELEKRVLRKLLINSVINPLTALLRIPNGQLLKTPERLSLARELFDETAKVLERSGLPDAANAWDEVAAVCEATATNLSSMLQDVQAGRATEIDAINGAVCRLAERNGLEAPLNAAVTALIKAL
ncbi:ketopantoate reductase family protein [Cohnella faecalis]|uniref:2-dehydropantoate 2-reductase n=1 Tax=Cohnella faecalis TaxID=2315694 RepID=A0A398CLM8_9BACL|nr:2-dehydropantoate 2-reductase [Cohnella faecalis]RIE04246.1 2-dehydropantoate 2-reductase [Cohnella faecalis]